jgi:hypothetical protein
MIEGGEEREVDAKGDRADKRVLVFASRLYF